MTVMDVTNEQAIRMAVGEARRAVLWMLFAAGLTALAAVLVVRGVDGVPAAVWWVLAGAFGSDTATQTGAAWRQWHNAREVRRCATCRTAAMQVEDADHRWALCAASGHGTGRRWRR